MTRDPVAYIADHLPVKAVPHLPRISLHLAVPESGVWRLAHDGTPPYWAWVWPGGSALAQHVVARPDIVAGKRVLDLGTGSGLVAIVAALAGASSVIACDIDPIAIAAARLNAALNRAAIEMLNADLLDGPVPDIECILAGDVFYETEVAARVLPFLMRCRDAGVKVLIGDIGRADLPKERLFELAAYPVSEFGDGTGPNARNASVYRLKADT